MIGIGEHQFIWVSRQGTAEVQDADALALPDESVAADLWVNGQPSGREGQGRTLRKPFDPIFVKLAVAVRPQRFPIFLSTHLDLLPIPLELCIPNSLVSIRP
ncbi:MAG: hypothetical protein CMO80_24880 [Verrucomicrobiales bacterium]|nr:hypothetical protein [Verrucomicrobiales bacterium]